ncbi:MAG: hypothetical protein Q9168_007415 [Polycauliona sp. 1 TL-2023]
MAIEGDASDTKMTPSPNLSHDPGLGILSCLPPELREQIWKEHFQDTATKLPTDKVAQHHCFDIHHRSTRQSSKAKHQQTPHAMAILRTSKQLNDEVLEHFYRHRVLIICLDDEYSALPVLDHFSTHLDGLCTLRVFSHTDFSKFRSIRLNVGVLRIGNPCHVQKNLKAHVDRFATLLGRWQRRKNEHYHQCPSINIDLSPYIACTQLPPNELPTYYRELAGVFRGLKHVKGIRDVTFHGLREDKEIMAPIFQDVIDEIKNPGKRFRMHQMVGTLHPSLGQASLVILVLCEAPKYLNLVAPNFVKHYLLQLASAYILLCIVVFELVFYERHSS